MEEDGVALNEVVVSTYRRNDTEMSLLEGMKAQVQVASGISSQQIAKTLDRDASEVVKRVPGISVIDDRFVVVRGLSQRYNNVWINGNSSPSLESDSRAFSFLRSREICEFQSPHRNSVPKVRSHNYIAAILPYL